MMQHAKLPSSAASLLTGPLDTTHIGVLCSQRGICARDRFQFGIEQTRNTSARYTGSEDVACGADTVLLADSFDNFVESLRP